MNEFLFDMSPERDNGFRLSALDESNPRTAEVVRLSYGDDPEKLNKVLRVLDDLNSGKKKVVDLAELSENDEKFSEVIAIYKQESTE